MSISAGISTVDGFLLAGRFFGKNQAVSMMNFRDLNLEPN